MMFSRAHYLPIEASLSHLPSCGQIHTRDPEVFEIFFYLGVYYFFGTLNGKRVKGRHPQEDQGVV